MATMADGREPVALAMILCDAIHVDPGTGKRTLLGLFSVLFAREFPVTHPLMAVYTCLTECHGKVPFTLRIVDVNEEREPVFEVSDEIDIGDPLGVAELDFRIGGLVFSAPGEYRCQLLSAGHPLIERRIIVIQVPGPDQASTEEPPDE
jgi:hypothetical protein